MVVLLGVLSLVTIPICLLAIVVQAIRKKPKKKWGITMIGSFVVFSSP